MTVENGAKDTACLSFVIKIGGTLGRKLGSSTVVQRLACSPHNKKALGSNMLIGSFPGYSHFLSLSKGMQIRAPGYSKLPTGVSVRQECYPLTGYDYVRSRNVTNSIFDVVMFK